MTKISLSPREAAVVQDPPRRRRSRRKWWYDLSDEHTQTFILLVGKREVLRRVAEATGLHSRQRAQQIRDIITDLFGKKVFVQPNRSLSLEEASERLGVSLSRLYNWVTEGRVRTVRRGSTQHHVTLTALEELQRRMKSTIPCTVCGKPIPVKVPPKFSDFSGGRSQRSVVLCGEGPCYSKRRLEHWLNRCEQRGAGDHKDWLAELFRALDQRTPPIEERWVSWKEACQIAGVCDRQLQFLEFGEVLRVMPHPWRISKTGLPVKTFAESELRLVRSAREKFPPHRSRTARS